ncbi:MAG: hypothetical protein ACLPUO_13870, partial [Streptosporangiaceae bacterium]
PGTVIPTGNPPSGIAAGYVFFDIAAIALAPRIVAAWDRRRAAGVPVAGPLAPVATKHAAHDRAPESVAASAPSALG